MNTDDRPLIRDDIDLPALLAVIVNDLALRFASAAGRQKPLQSFRSATIITPLPAAASKL